MNIQTSDIEQIIKIIGNQGLGFFALYIIYHYLGKIVTMLLIIKIVSQIIKVVDKWIFSWFQFREEEMKVYHKK